MLIFGTYPNIVGASVPKFQTDIDGNMRSLERNVLRNVWNNNNNDIPRAIGGFRAVMNAGDYLSRVNNSCGGSNQVGTRPGVLRLTKKDGVGHCYNQHVPTSNTNVKYVYDSSDFTRYRREKSINKGYSGADNHLTDYSYGGSGSPLGRGRQKKAGNLNSYA